MLSTIKFFKTKIFEISVGLCFLLPPVGILFLFVLSFSTIYHTLKARKRLNFSLPFILFLCLFIATVGAVFQMKNLTLLVGSMMVLGYWGLYQRVISNGSEENFRRYRWIVILGGVYNCLIGFAGKSLITHPVIGFLTGTLLFGGTPSVDYSRLIGSAYNPNFTMYLLLLSMAFVFAEMLIYFRKKQYPVLALLIPILLILSVGVIATGSRAGYFTMVCIYILFFMRINKVIFITTSVILLGSIKPLFDLMPRTASLDQSYQVREQIWINSLELWGHHPLFGTTPLGFRQAYIDLFAQDVPHAHDIFIGFFAEYGILGGIPFLIFVCTTVYKCVNLFFYRENNNGLLDYFLLSLPIIIFTGVLDEPIFSPQIALLTIVLLGYWEVYSNRFAFSYLVLPAVRLKEIQGRNSSYEKGLLGAQHLK